MSLFQFKAQPARVTGDLKGPLLLFSKANDKPRYKNLMFDEHVFRGTTLPSQIAKLDFSKSQNNYHQSTTKLKFKENKEIENKVSNVDMKFELRFKSKSKKPHKFGNKMNNLFLADSTADKNSERLIMTPRASEGFRDGYTMTDEYLEILTDTFPQKDADVQTEPLLSRCVKREKILHFVGQEKATQITKQDYLVDFNEQTESVIRVIMNKVLEQGRMEVLEELEFKKLKEEKRESHQDKMKMLNHLQRTKAKEERIKDEIEKRILQNQLAKENLISVHQKLIGATVAKGIFNKAQTSVEREILDLRKYLEISEAKIWTNVLPPITDKIYESIDREEEQGILADKLIEDCLANIILFHQQNIRK
jgi:hypothetical protein